MFPKNRNKGGFTLVEMIVSLAIVTIILSTVLFNYSSFTDNLAVSAAAQELAITIRQAQTYGIAVKQTGGGLFTQAYGVHVETSVNTSYILFTDADNDKLYDSPGELAQQNTFRNGVTVSGLSSTVNLIVGNPTSLDISFLRPSPDARIFSPGASGNATIGVVTLKSPRGKTITVTVQSTGEVLVGQPH